MQRTISIHSAAMPTLLGEAALVISHLQGEENLSELYSYTLTAVTPDNDAISWQAASGINIKSFIGKQVTIILQLDDHRPAGHSSSDVREISGIVQQVRYVGRDENQAIYQMILRPWLYLAELTSDFRIFQDKSVTDIIDQILAEYDFPCEKRLSAVYPVLEFQVQYGETDFSFIQRLMEEWGIYWFFEHADRQHKLVMVDNPAAHQHFTRQPHTVTYADQAPHQDAEYVSRFHYQQTITSGRWVTDDYDFTRSRADIMSLNSKPRQTSYSQQEIFDWPGNYANTTTGELLAKVRMEERGATGLRSFGAGPVAMVVCGYNFTLTGYPLNKANCEYLVLASQLEISEISQRTGSHRFTLQCEFTVQPASKIYRHPRTMMKKRTCGPQTALVVGPPGEDIWTDEYGRVKVRFLWDRYGTNSESDSCWLRVSQPWAGNNFGGICIPRIGHEVIVDFINGDPDRPLILGSLYNNVTMPPWDLPVNATQSGLISRTVGGGRSNFNGIRFEDKPGQETYWEQAEQDMHRLTKRDEQQVIGQSRKVFVGVNDALSVIGDSQLTVGAGLGIAVGGGQKDNVGGAKGINVGGAFMTAVGGYHSVAVGGAHQLAAGGAATFSAGGIMTLTSEGELIICAPRVRIIGSGQLILQGGQVDINPGDGPVYGPTACCCGAIVGMPGLPGLYGLAGIFVKLKPRPTPTPTSTPVPTPTPTETPMPEPTFSPDPEILPVPDPGKQSG